MGKRTAWSDVRAMFSTRDPELTPEERREVYNAQCRDRYRTRIDVKQRVKAVGKRWYYERGGREVMRASQRRRLYGATREHCDAMFAAQEGICAMPGCKKPATDLDHDHATGRIRALLCRSCNYGLGTYERIREVAALYLARFTDMEG